ncbi:MAG: acyl-CoA dehydrogenase family protein [Myxococcota bacterium]
MPALLPMNGTEAGRAGLLEFERLQPDNFWRSDAHLQRVVKHLGGEATKGWLDGLDRFGAECAGPIDTAVRSSNLPQNLPRLDRWSPYGERVEEVEFHPSYHEAGAMIYGSGVMSVLGDWGGNLRSMALFYLSSHNGEAGHNCPLACTAGLIKAVKAVGSPELQERYLGRLLSNDYAALAHGAQFLTEVQGGSDVGANAVRAVPDSSGVAPYRIHGEKWFCSNCTADLILMTARPEGAPEGTKGLGLFLVPRRLPDGTLNHYALRRLKEKLGTRSMASAEIDFQGAYAWNVGEVSQGFNTVMTWVINTSRVVNAFGCAGIARRASITAHTYAQARSAFGTAIANYPLVQETLADMRTETDAMVSGSLYLAHLMDRAETGKLAEADAAYLRMAVNVNKMRTAVSSHEVALEGIEVLGGNGAIETFSVLPRLLRDNVVFENWEGTHNVLITQVWKDSQRKGMHKAFFAHLAAQAKGDARLTASVDSCAKRFAETLDAPDDVATLRMRPLTSEAAWLVWACAMANDGTERAVIDHFLDRRIGPQAPRDAAYAKRIKELAARP